MKDLIRLSDCKEEKIFSRDLREFVVPVRVLENLKRFEEKESDSELPKDAIKALFNRCAALTGGSLCIFCNLRKECDTFRSIR